MIEQLIELHLKNFSAENILDVGPGFGSFSRVAARITGAKHVTFLDCNTSVLQWQKEENKKHSLQSACLFTNLSKEDLLKLEGNFDLILCQEVLEHLYNAQEILQILSNKLTLKGRIVITVPTKRSERWLKMINPQYMRDELYGHVTEFDERKLQEVLADSNLVPLVFIPTQPHYFIFHTWVFGTRMKIDGSTGAILSEDVRNRIGDRLLIWARRFFKLTGYQRWGQLLPRNYFVVAERSRR